MIRRGDHILIIITVLAWLAVPPLVLVALRDIERARMDDTVRTLLQIMVAVPAGLFLILLASIPIAGIHSKWVDPPPPRRLRGEDGNAATKLLVCFLIAAQQAFSVSVYLLRPDDWSTDRTMTRLGSVMMFASLCWFILAEVFKHVHARATGEFPAPTVSPPPEASPESGDVTRG